MYCQFRFLLDSQEGAQMYREDPCVFPAIPPGAMGSILDNQTTAGKPGTEARGAHTADWYLSLL